MAQASLRPPCNLQPRPKGVPTFSSTPGGAVSRSVAPQLSRPSSRSRHPSPVRAATPIDSPDIAVSALVRRVLCPHTYSTADRDRPVDELLPPLTSSNDVDLQLYAIVAIIVKDLVHSWYSKITADQTFVEEVAKIIAHCTRALESRIRHVDLESLIFDEIPALVESHLNAFRVAHHNSQSQELSTKPEVIYHHLDPHPALEPIPDHDNPTSIAEQATHECRYRQLLAQGALAVLLPTEDLENACLRRLVADVIAEPVLGLSIGGKASEGWFIWSSITKLVAAIKGKVEHMAPGEDMEFDNRSRLERFGLLAETEAPANSSDPLRSRLSSTFLRLLHYAYLTFTVIRFILVGLLAALSGPSRSSTIPKLARSANSSLREAACDPASKAAPILEFRVFPLASKLVDLPHRMPWLSGVLALLRHHLSQGLLKRVGDTDGILDQ